MRISFLILNYNRVSFLDRAIRSCLNQYIFGFEREIIVVDDNSSDDSLEVLSKYGKNINLPKLSPVLSIKTNTRIDELDKDLKVKLTNYDIVNFMINMFYQLHSLNKKLYLKEQITNFEHFNDFSFYREKDKIIVSSADSKYFFLLKELFLSLDKSGILSDYQFSILDTGLTEEQRFFFLDNSVF